jgi:meiotically up-regulated gene 157 (Mug157) protein
MFVNCYPNTLDTTVHCRTLADGTPDTFIITGDIPAMWLRDSAAQVWPYLHLMPEDPGLRLMVEGLLRRMCKSVLIDPYANAFLHDPNCLDTHFGADATVMLPGVYERKWEVDSLAYVLRLSTGYWSVTKATGLFDQVWLRAIRLILETFEVQRGDRAQDVYGFQRHSHTPTDSLPNEGRGNPGKSCGLIRSAFRCSDDSTIFPYLIPSNLMAAAELGRLAELLLYLGQTALADRARVMSDDLRRAVNRYGIVDHPIHGPIYAYEVDGYGSVLLMDDAGIPGLLSLPYLDAVAADDPVYMNTRAYVLSEDNPYYHRGVAVAGIGSPHTNHGSVWPMGLIAKGLTSTDPSEVEAVVYKIAEIDGGTGFVHESVNPDDPTRFTRGWFAWVNGLYGELIARWVGLPLYNSWPSYNLGEATAVANP